MLAITLVPDGTITTQCVMPVTYRGIKHLCVLYAGRLSDIYQLSQRLCAVRAKGECDERHFIEILFTGCGERIYFLDSAAELLGGGGGRRVYICSRVVYSVEVPMVFINKLIYTYSLIISSPINNHPLLSITCGLRKVNDSASMITPSKSVIGKSFLLFLPERNVQEEHSIKYHRFLLCVN